MTPATACSMIAAIMRALQGMGHVAVGASSPIPAAAALLARAKEPSMRVSILGSEADNPFTDGGRELFDCAAQGRIDAFFFSGVQIDHTGAINLLGLGQPPHMTKRFIGNFGAPYLAGLIPNIILFRTDHSAKGLVEQADFISAPGTNVRWLVTNLGVFEKRGGRMVLRSRHEGVSFAEIARQTGFAVQHSGEMTKSLSMEEHQQLKSLVLPRMQALYPQFVSLMG